MREVEILKTAKAKLEKGWAKGHLHIQRFGDGEDLYCSIGALDHLYGCSPRDQEVKSSMGYLHAAIFNYKSCDWGDLKKIERWNDQGDRGKEDVVAAYDKAIELAAKDAAG